MASSTGGAIGKDLYEQLIDTLNSIFGSHPGYRPVHAKGVMCEGEFQPTTDAALLTRAPHMQGNRVPVHVRFSDFSGVPVVRDGDPAASPRGMAVRFQLKDGSATDIVAQSYNGFPARDAPEFLSFLRALASSGPGAPKPTALDTFLANHPAARLFVEDPKPAPKSFATESYYAVDAFRFINREQRSRFGRYRISPVAGEQHLDLKDAAKLPDNYLFTELTSRLEGGSRSAQLSDVGSASEGSGIPGPAFCRACLLHCRSSANGPGSSNDARQRRCGQRRHPRRRVQRLLSLPHRRNSAARRAGR